MRPRNRIDLILLALIAVSLLVMAAAAAPVGTVATPGHPGPDAISKTPLPDYRFFNVHVANDEGVKYDVQNGAAAEGGTYTYVPNTYWVMFRQAGGGLNPLHFSSTSNAWSAADITRTPSQSGSFWITFSGGQPSLPEGILMLAVNGTIADDFRIHIRSSGYEFDPGTPGTTNQGLPNQSTYLDGAVDQTFTKSDFIYGPQSWKPCSTSGYPIYGGEDQADPNNQFQLMFIDLRVGALQNASLANNGMIRVEYSFENLHSLAVFNAYGWYMTCNHGTGIIMTNDVGKTGYQVVGTPSVPPTPTAAFSASPTSGTAPLAVQFTDASTGDGITSRAWDFGDGGTSTEKDPSHTYTTAGTYTVSLTVTNAGGSDSETKAGFITVTAPTTTTATTTTTTVTTTTPAPDLPSASFTASRRAGIAPAAVRFADSSTGSPTTWIWDFGDGASSTEQHPSHTYTAPGTYTVSLTAANGRGMNTSSVPAYITVLGALAALPDYHAINVLVANDAGVKYDVPNGAVASGGTYEYVPNTYWMVFREPGGGLNPLHISGTSNAFFAADITRTANQSGSFWVTYGSDQPTMSDVVLLLAVNGTIPDDFRVRIRSNGNDFDVGTPSTDNQPLPANATHLEGAVDQVFDKDDFLYGPQAWRPSGSAGYPIFGGEAIADPSNQFRLMFIDLGVAPLKNASLPDNGMVRVEYAFENLESFAVFNVYGWFMQNSKGTGVTMTNNALTSSYQVTGTSTPGVVQLPGGTGLPRDLDGDGKYEDVNGNGRKDFADVTLYFNQMTWCAANEPVAAFDYNGNGRIDFADVTWLFNHL
jgi:PKD repeat protein